MDDFKIRDIERYLTLKQYESYLKRKNIKLNMKELLHSLYNLNSYMITHLCIDSLFSKTDPKADVLSMCREWEESMSAGITKGLDDYMKEAYPRIKGKFKYLIMRSVNVQVPRKERGHYLEPLPEHDDEPVRLEVDVVYHHSLGVQPVVQVVELLDEVEALEATDHALLNLNYSKAMIKSCKVMWQNCETFYIYKDRNFEMSEIIYIDINMVRKEMLKMDSLRERINIVEMSGCTNEVAWIEMKVLLNMTLRIHKDLWVSMFSGLRNCERKSVLISKKMQMHAPIWPNSSKEYTKRVYRDTTLITERSMSKCKYKVNWTYRPMFMHSILTEKAELILTEMMRLSLKAIKFYLKISDWSYYLSMSLIERWEYYKIISELRSQFRVYSESFDKTMSSDKDHLLFVEMDFLLL
jgi:hypothetical protein